MNGDNKMESDMVELHMQNPQNLLTMVLCDPVYTVFFIQSFAMFCYGYLLKLRGPAWAVANYSISQPAGGNSQNSIYET